MILRSSLLAAALGTTLILSGGCSHQQKTGPESIPSTEAEPDPNEESLEGAEEVAEQEEVNPEEAEQPAEVEAPEQGAEEAPPGPEGEVAKRSADGIDDDTPLPQPGPAREKFDEAVKQAVSDPAAAVETFLAAAGETTYFYAAFYNAAVSAERAKNEEQAEQLYLQCLGERPDYGPCLINLVYMYHRQGRPDQSALMLQEALEKQGDRAGPHVAAATKAFIDRDFKKLEKECKQAIAYDERNIPAMYLMARMFFAQEKFETAKFALENALVLEPGNALLQLWLGHTFMRFDDYTQAELAYEKASRLRPDLDEAQENYGLLLLRADRFQAAVRHLEAAVALTPQKAETSLHLANAYRASKRYEEAEDYYMKAFELNQELVGVHYNLGLMYMDNEIPGMDYLERLNKAQERFDLYAQAEQPVTKENERLPEFQKTVKKRIRKETKKRQRAERRRLLEEAERIEEEERKAAEEAAAAEAAESASEEPQEGAEGEPGDETTDPEGPGADEPGSADEIEEGSPGEGTAEQVEEPAADGTAAPDEAPEASEDAAPAPAGDPASEGEEAPVEGEDSADEDEEPGLSDDDFDEEEEDK